MDGGDRENYQHSVLVFICRYSCCRSIFSVSDASVSGRRGQKGESDMEEDAEYQMFLSFKEERAGKLEKAVEHMQKAKAAVKDTDFFLKTQILCNYGRLMVLVGNFTEADFYFIKARDLANANKKKELLHPIYYNLLVNWCKLGKSREEVERGLRDYYFRLDMEQMDHILEFNNLQVILARQMEDYELLHRRIGEGFEEMLRLPLTKEQRLVYLGPMARMVCTARSNPERCLEEIEKEIDGMFRMQMPDRYWILKQIGYMFGPLYYPKYDGIRVKVNEYLDRQAEDDIRNYMQKLPEECVFERCQLWEELSGLASRNPDTYDFTTVLRNMEWSRDTLLRNGLYLNAALVDTHMAEECAAPWNLDDNMIPIHHKEMLEYVEHAEALLADARQHPEMQEAWLYLSYQSYHLMRYEKCREHFRRFRSFHISLAHFTPEFQQIYAGCAMINHILDFYFAWKDLEKNTHRQQALSEEARMWFQKPVQQREVDLCMLLAKHMGYKGVRLKHSFWFEKAGESVVQKAHCWLLANEGGLEVDLLYDLFPMEEEPQRLLFMEGRHPMETDESVTIIRGRETGLVVKDHVICRWYAFDETFEKSVLGEVYDAISADK